MIPDPRSVDDHGAYDAYERALLRLSRLSLRDNPCAEEVLNEAGEIIAATLGVTRVGIWFFLDDARAIRCEYLYHHGRVESYEGTILHASDFPTYFGAITRSRAVPVTAATTDEIAQEFGDAYLKPLGITAMLDVPIYRGGSVAGIVCHEHTGPPRRWTDDECHFASSVGDIAGRLCEEALRHRAEQTAERYERHLESLHYLSAMGRLATGVAHDFNNVLTTIVGYADLIREIVRDRPDVLAHLGELDASVQVGCRLAERLLTYGRPGPGRPRVANPAEIVERSRRMLERAAASGPTLRFEIGDDAGRVFIDPVEVERILLNLVVNARDATPPDGTITVTLRAAPLPGGRNGSQYVLLEVSDTGHGIDAALHRRVLEPFFTTKGASGTGLGLAIVNRAATCAGGFVEIESQPGHGTRVRVYLPRIAAMQS